MAERVCVTGGHGFVGRAVIQHLLEAGHAVTILDQVLPRTVAALGQDVRTVTGDIRDANSVDTALSGCDAVVHLAAATRVQDSIEDPLTNIDVNVNGTQTVLDRACRAGVNRFIAASTGGALAGDATPPIHEHTPPWPKAPYGAGKLATEGLASAYAGAYGITGIVLRFSNIYGPGSWHKGSAVAAFMRSILERGRIDIAGDGEQTRDFLHVDDAARAVVRALAHPTSDVFQLGMGAPVSLNDLTRRLRKTVDRDHADFGVRYTPRPPGEVDRTWCDVTRARERLGFTPTIGLDDGLRETWSWFRNRCQDNAVSVSTTPERWPSARATS